MLRLESVTARPATAVSPPAFSSFYFSVFSSFTALLGSALLAAWDSYVYGAGAQPSRVGRLRDATLHDVIASANRIPPHLRACVHTYLPTQTYRIEVERAE